jgi:hypothetical protein
MVCIEGFFNFISLIQYNIATAQIGGDVNLNAALEICFVEFSKSKYGSIYKIIKN